jgi:hypothetical protein
MVLPSWVRLIPLLSSYTQKGSELNVIPRYEIESRRACQRSRQLEAPSCDWRFSLTPSLCISTDIDHQRQCHHQGAPERHQTSGHSINLGFPPRQAFQNSSISSFDLLIEALSHSTLQRRRAGLILFWGFSSRGFPGAPSAGLGISSPPGGARARRARSARVRSARVRRGSTWRHVPNGYH